MAPGRSFGRLETAVEPVRKYGTRSFVQTIFVVGTLAGLLSASAIPLKLWQYMLIALGVFVAALVISVLNTARYKFWLFSLLYRRPVKRHERLPYHRHLKGTTPEAPVLQVAAGRKIDRVYEGGFRTLLDASNPVAVIASNPRDVSRKDKLPAGMYGRGGSRTECVVDPSVFGIPLERYSFERHMTEGTQDTDHMLATKDIVYLPHLAMALRRGSDSADPFIWIEHCVDIPFLSTHDVVVVGGGDSNFWHAALFEPVLKSFESPKSTVPLALDLRDPAGSLSFYGSQSINVNLWNRELIPGLEKARRHELNERSFPTCAMILACENPFARAAGRRHWCDFVAGTRSLGTSGAILGLAAMVDRMREDPTVNYSSLVRTEEPDVLASVSALLTRTVRCEYAADSDGGAIRDRGWNDIPVDRPDPDYRDSYVPIGVEYLDNHGDVPVWRPLVELERDAAGQRTPELAYA